MRSSVVLIRTKSLLTGSEVVDNILIIDQNEKKQFHTDATQRLIRKLDLRLLPFFLLLELSSFINRVNIGHAKLMGIRTNRHISDSEWNWANSLFYIAYIIFAIPSNLLLRVIGVTRYLSLSMIAWGVITVGMAFVNNGRELLIIRFLLGMTQAGYFPSIIIYFSLWYCKREQIMRITLLSSAAIASSVVGGIFAYGMLKMKGIGDLEAWQWMFLFEGLPIIVLGMITYRFLDNVPNAVQWLNNMEKQDLTNLLQNDADISSRNSISTSRISWREVYYAFIDYRIYLYAIIAGGFNAVIRCLSTFLPLLVQSMGYSNDVVQLMTTPPYAVACICCLMVGYSSSRRHEHSYHLVFCLIISLLGFIVMITPLKDVNVVMYISTTVSLCGSFSALPLILSWLTNNVGGHTKRAMAISFVIGINQIGGTIVFLIYPDTSKSSYQRGHLISIGMLTISLITTIILRISLIRENNRRRNFSAKEYQNEIDIKESCDWHPDVLYKL